MPKVGAVFTYQFVSSGLEKTQELAAGVAARVAQGDTIVLVGELGAGKTCFVQGFARSLGIAAPVTSPTFALANRYEGRMLLNHLDVYRLNSPAEAQDLDLFELAETGVTVVEWGDRLGGLLPEDRLEIEFVYSDDPGTPNTRNVTLRGYGKRWDGLDWSSVSELVKK